MPLANIKCRESVPGQGITKLKGCNKRRFTVAASAEDRVRDVGHIEQGV